MKGETEFFLLIQHNLA